MSVKRKRETFAENLVEETKPDGTRTYYYVPRIEGKKVWIKLNVRDRSDAKRKKKTKIAEAERREIRPSADSTFKDSARAYLDKQHQRTLFKDGGICGETVALMECDYRVHIAQLETDAKGKLRLTDDIDTDVIEPWLKELKTKLGVSGSRRTFNLLGRILREHYRIHGGTNPYDRVDPDLKPKRKKGSKKKVVVPKPDAIYGFIAKVSDDLRFLVILVAFTGMRISEALGLRWMDIDWNARTITCRKQRYRGRLKESAKTAAGTDRVIPILDFLYAELELRFDAEVLAGRGGDEDFVGLVDGQHTTDTKVLNAAQAAARVSGLGYITTHRLRHWYVSTLLWAGVPPYVVKDIVGHDDGSAKDITTTYTHSYQQDETMAMVQERCRAIGFGNFETEKVEA